MTEWKYLVPEICPHGVDQRHKFSTEMLEDGSTISKMDRMWCRECLAAIDVEAIMQYWRDQK